MTGASLVTLFLYAQRLWWQDVQKMCLRINNRWRYMLGPEKSPGEICYAAV